jgi:hypothetical protein
MHDSYPTTSTTILPSPESIFVPLKRIGDGTSCLSAKFFYPLVSTCCFLLMQYLRIFFLIGYDSPVMALSSVDIS